MSERRVLAGPPRHVGADEHVLPGLDDLRALVTLSRTHWADCRQRHVFARLDDADKMRLGFGDSVTLEVRPGGHDLRVQNTLIWKNVYFTIELGEHLDFVISHEARWWTPGMLAVLGAALLCLRVDRRSRR